MKEEDKQLFRSMFADAKPVKSDKVQHNTRSNKSSKAKKAFEQQQISKAQENAEKELLSAESYTDDQIESLQANSVLSFYRAGVQLRQFQKLKQGKFPLEADLDLHGQTKEQARSNTYRFIKDAEYHGLRCVLIVHGKGKNNQQGIAVIKTQLASWLKQEPSVLAYHSAKDRHGGLGAVYVLLRKLKEEHVNKQ